MVLKGGAKQSECLAEKASELGDADIVSNCKCKAFRNIKNTVGSVKNMMCIDLRESRNFGYGYGMNTIWFQYLLCKDMSFACYYFTQGWNQGDFGQYYLYDNLLDSSSGLTDDALLTLAVVGGGLGGGYRPRYTPTHGHYYPTTPEPEPEPETEPEPVPEPLHRRRRSSAISSIRPTPTEARRRRSEEKSSSPARRRRSEEKSSSPARRRRSVEESSSPDRRRRSVEKSSSRDRRRRSEELTTSPARRRRD